MAKEQRQLNRKRKIEAFLSLVGMEKLAESDVSVDAIKSATSAACLHQEDKTTVRDLTACSPSSTLTREELVQLRARLAQQKKLRKLRSQFYLRAPYFRQQEDAVPQQNLSSNLTDNRSLTNSEIQQLLLFAFEGGCAYQKPQWCVLNNWHRLSQCICIVVDGVDLQDFVEFHSDAFPFTSQEFKLAEHGVRLIPVLPGNLPVDELLHVPKGLVEFNKVQKRTFYDQMLRQTLKKVSSSRSDPLVADVGGADDAEVSKTKLLLSAPAMIAEHFPSYNTYTRQISSDAAITTITSTTTQNTGIVSGSSISRRSISATLGILSKPHVQQHKQQPYVATKEVYTSVGDSSPMFAVDCEMCLTSARRNELTRVSLVDENLNVLYDSYVKPHNKIVHYLTQYSGVTASHMVNCTTRLSDVQEKLRELLPSDAILIGHSLNFDLHALNMIHPYVIDTSCIFNLTGTQHRKSKLQHLAQVLLNQSIQCGGKHGHSSIEDARATMELVKLKLTQNSQIFGDTRLGFQYQHSADETENSMVEPDPTTSTTVAAECDVTDISVKIEEADEPTKISTCVIEKITTTIVTSTNGECIDENDDSKVMKLTSDTNANVPRRSTSIRNHMLHDWCTPLTSHFVEHKTRASVILKADSYDHFVQLNRRSLTPEVVDDMVTKSSNNKNVVKMVRESLLNGKSFVFAELSALASAESETSAVDDDLSVRAGRLKQLRKIDHCIQQIMGAVQDNALACVIFQRRQPADADDATDSLTLDDKLGLAFCKVTNFGLHPPVTKTEIV